MVTTLCVGDTNPDCPMESLECNMRANDSTCGNVPTSGLTRSAEARSVLGTRRCSFQITHRSFRGFSETYEPGSRAIRGSGTEEARRKVTTIRSERNH